MISFFSISSCIPRLFRVIFVVVLHIVLSYSNFVFSQAALTVSPPLKTVTINQKTSQLDPATSFPVLFTVVFSAPIIPTTFTIADISTTGSTAPGITIDSITQVAPHDDTTFEVSVSATGPGTIVAHIPSVSDPNAPARYGFLPDPSRTSTALIQYVYTATLTTSKITNIARDRYDNSTSVDNSVTVTRVVAPITPTSTSIAGEYWKKTESFSLNETVESTSSSHDGKYIVGTLGRFGLLFSEDSGKNWTTKKFGTSATLYGASNISIVSSTVSADGSKIVLTAIGDPGSVPNSYQPTHGNTVFVSQDFGKTWAHRIVFPQGSELQVHRIAGSSSGQHLFLTTSDRYRTPNINPLYISSDFGGTWRKYDTPEPKEFVWSNVSISHDGTRMYAYGSVSGQPMKLYYSLNSGDSWQKQDLDVSLVSIQATGDGATLFGLVSGSTHLVQSGDYGATWSVFEDIDIVDKKNDSSCVINSFSVGRTRDDVAYSRNQYCGSHTSGYPIHILPDGSKHFRFYGDYPKEIVFFEKALDTTPPLITSVTSTKMPGTYLPGSHIHLRVNFSERLTGPFTIKLNANQNNLSCTGFAMWTYSQCTYVVGVGETVNELDVVSVTGVLDDGVGNTIRTAVPITNLSTTSDIKIAPLSGSAYSWKSLLSTSTSFTNWHRITSSSDGKYMYAIGYGDGQASPVLNFFRFYGFTNVDGEGGGYLYRSEDSGKTWQQITSLSPAHWNSISSSIDGKYVVASQTLAESIVDGEYRSLKSMKARVFVSNDFGVTWTDDQLQTSLEAGSTIHGSYLFPNVFARPDGTGYYSSMQVSQNSLSSASETLGNALSGGISPMTHDSSSLIFKYSTAGVSRISPASFVDPQSLIGQPDENGFVSYAIENDQYHAPITLELAQSADGNRLYALSASTLMFSESLGYEYSGHTLRTSGDSGKTWSTLALPPGSVEKVSSSTDGKYVAIIVKSSTSILPDGTTYNRCSTNCRILYTSDNFGQTWVRRTQGQHDFVDITISDDGKNLASIVGTRGFGYRGLFYGLEGISHGLVVHDNWRNRPRTVDPGRDRFGSSNQYIYTSTDSGVTWVEEPAGERVWSDITASPDGTMITAVSKDGFIYTGTSAQKPPIITPPIGQIVVRDEKITINTDVTSTCKYSTDPNTSYDAMTGTLVTTDGLVHAIDLSGLAEGDYTYFILCKSTATGAISPEYPITFTVGGKCIIGPSASPTQKSCQTFCPTDAIGLSPNCLCSDTTKTYDPSTSTCILGNGERTISIPSQLKTHIDEPYIICRSTRTADTHIRYRVTSSDAGITPFISEIFPQGTPVLHGTMKSGNYTVECFYGSASFSLDSTAPMSPTKSTIRVHDDADGCNRMYAYKNDTLSDEMISQTSFGATFRCGSRRPVPESQLTPFRIFKGNDLPIDLARDSVISSLFSGLSIGSLSQVTRSFPITSGSQFISCAVEIGSGYSTNNSCYIDACVGSECKTPQTYSMIHSGDSVCTNEPQSSYSFGCNPLAPSEQKNKCISKFREAIETSGRNILNGTRFDVNFEFNGNPTLIQCTKYEAGSMPGGMNLSDNVICDVVLQNGQRQSIYSADDNALQTLAVTKTFDDEKPTISPVKFYRDDTFTSEIDVTKWLNTSLYVQTTCTDGPMNESSDCACSRVVHPLSTDSNTWMPGIPNSIIGADVMKYSRHIIASQNNASVRVSDTAGNESTSEAFSVSIDTKSPDVTAHEVGTGSLRDIIITATDSGSKLWKTRDAPVDPHATKNHEGIVYRVANIADYRIVKFDNTCDSIADFASPLESNNASFPSRATVTIPGVNLASHIVVYCIRDNAGNTKKGIYPTQTDACFSSSHMRTIPTLDTYKAIFVDRLGAFGVDSPSTYGYTFSQSERDATCFRGVLHQNIMSLVVNQLFPRTSNLLTNWVTDLSMVRDVPSIPNTQGYYYYEYTTTNNTLDIRTPPTGTGPKSVVVRGGNIRISTDLPYTDTQNELFIIAQKNEQGVGGDIVIDSSVTRIDAIIIADGGVIRSSDIITPSERLVINGRIYSYNTRGGSLGVNNGLMIDSSSPRKFINAIITPTNLTDAMNQDLERLRPIILDGTNECSFHVNYKVFGVGKGPLLGKVPANYSGANCGF